MATVPPSSRPRSLSSAPRRCTDARRNWGVSVGAGCASSALNALTTGETSEYQVHLSYCAYCRAVVTYFNGVVDSLAVAAEPAPVNPAVRARLMAAVRAGMTWPPEDREGAR